MSCIGRNHSLLLPTKSAAHLPNLCSIHILPCWRDRSSQSINTATMEPTGLTLHTLPNRIIQRIKIRTGRRPHCLWPKMRHMTCQEILCGQCSVSWSTIPLPLIVIVRKFLTQLGHDFVLEQLLIPCSIHFISSFDENGWTFSSTTGNHAQHHHGGRMLGLYAEVHLRKGVSTAGSA